MKKYIFLFAIVCFTLTGCGANSQEDWQNETVFGDINIEATEGTAKFLRKNGIKTRIKKKISEGSEEILDSIKKGYVTYVINSSNNSKSTDSFHDGKIIRRAAIDNNVPVFTCLDTVKVLLDVLEEITMKVSVIDEE